jgi:fructose-bisphosphate aldolase class I
MDNNILPNTITHLLASQKGILAMDESTASYNKRFEAVGISTTVEMRRSYRELIVITPNLENHISGAILVDETIHQQTKDGTRFLDILRGKGILPGIKVDRGTVDLAGFPDEKITEGLDGFREKLAGYNQMGAKFAKWRGVITINGALPSSACLYANCHSLAVMQRFVRKPAWFPLLSRKSS